MTTRILGDMFINYSDYILSAIRHHYIHVYVYVHVPCVCIEGKSTILPVKYKATEFNTNLFSGVSQFFHSEVFSQQDHACEVPDRNQKRFDQLHWCSNNPIVCPCPLKTCNGIIGI